MSEVTPSTDKFGFDLEVQAKVVALLLVDPRSLGDCVKIMRPEHFDNPIDQRMAGIMLKYLADYDQPITVEILDAEFQKLLRERAKLEGAAEEYRSRYTHILDQVNEEGLAYARDQARDWLIHQTYRTTILESVDAIKAKDFDKIDQLYAKAQEIRFGSVGDSGVEMRALSEVPEEEVEWLWDQKFVKNGLNLILGYPGVGKSYFTLFMASVISTGGKFPDDTRPVPQGDILILSCEDSEGIIKSRVVGLGGDCSRMSVIRGTKNGKLFSLVSDLPRLHAVLNKKPHSLLIVDPMDAYWGIGKLDTHKTSDVRAVLAMLAQLASDCKITIIGIVFPNKSSDVTTLQRISGSISFGAAPRAIWCVGVDENDETLRYLTKVKSNYARHALPLSWRITEAGSFEAVRDHVAPSSDEQLASPSARRGPNKSQLAEKFLKVCLSDGPVPAEEVIGRAEDEGINRHTLGAVKRALGVMSEKRPNENGDWQKGQFWWALPVSDAAESAS